MNGCIYLVTCLENNKKYVGQHCKSTPTKRWNEHKRAKKNYPFPNAIRKYGPTGFSWEVLLVCPLDKLTEMEGYYAEVFETYVWDSPGGYNSIWCSDTPTLGIKQSPEAKEKNRQANLGKKHTLETKEKISKANLGKKQSPEAVENGRQARVGKKHSPEHIENLRQANIGKKRSPEAIENLRQAHLGKKASPEAVENMRQARLGKKASPEAIENMRIAQQKRQNQHLVQDPPLTFSLP